MNSGRNAEYVLKALCETNGIEYVFLYAGVWYGFEVALKCFQLALLIKYNGLSSCCECYITCQLREKLLLSEVTFSQSLTTTDLTIAQYAAFSSGNFF